MKVAFLAVEKIVSNSLHNGFTSICHWNGRYYLAFREAPSHNIIPPGCIRILSTTSPSRLLSTWKECGRIMHPARDYRDPRFIPTADMLWLMTGAYMPSPHLEHIHGLSAHSGDNQIWTYLIATRDGVTWTPPQPILRPNHWGWSALADEKRWWVLSYDTGAMEMRNTITAWYGTPFTGFRHSGVLYDGGSVEKEQGEFRYRASMPSEPVLYQPAPHILACFLRTESTMLLGVWQASHAWRWHETGLLLHPSDIKQTTHGWLLAARELTPVYRTGKRRHGTSQAYADHDTQEIERYDTSVTLWHVDANRLEKVLTLPGSGDCAYASVCEWGGKPGEWFVSYYASDKAPGTCADVFVAKIKIEA